VGRETLAQSSLTRPIQRHCSGQGFRKNLRHASGTLSGERNLHSSSGSSKVLAKLMIIYTDYNSAISAKEIQLNCRLCFVLTTVILVRHTWTELDVLGTNWGVQRPIPATQLARVCLASCWGHLSWSVFHERAFYMKVVYVWTATSIQGKPHDDDDDDDDDDILQYVALMLGAWRPSV